jgi:hypothetical protein
MVARPVKCPGEEIAISGLFAIHGQSANLLFDIS